MDEKNYVGEEFLELGKHEHIIYDLSDAMRKASEIDMKLLEKHSVKRGLRNANGTGVLVGLTRIGNVVGYEKTEDGEVKPVAGKLFYRGVDVEDIVHSLHKEGRHGYEEIAYLLLSGSLPNRSTLSDFSEVIQNNMALEQKTRMHIIDLEGKNIMNILARSVLEMYTYDPNPDDLSQDNLMRQSICLISKFPTIIAYAYNILRHTQHNKTLHIRHPQEKLSIAENLLYMIKYNYTPLESRVLDLLLMLQAEHGGGNNSTFAVRVTSSTGTDTYSAISTGICALKGPLHGGANIMVNHMRKHLQENVKDWKDNNEIDAYLDRMLNKEVYDKSGLIYGLGHAVYTVSDPRSILLKELARELAIETKRVDEYNFLELLEARAIDRLRARKGNAAKLLTNVDFYSGFVYEMLGIPEEIYTPLFAMARIVGWCSHRNEELSFAGKRIMRPGYMNIMDEVKYQPLSER